MGSSSPLTSSLSTTLESDERGISKAALVGKQLWTQDRLTSPLTAYKVNGASESKPADRRSPMDISPPITSTSQRGSSSRVLLPPPIITSPEILRKLSSSHKGPAIPRKALGERSDNAFATRTSGSDNSRRPLPHVATLDPKFGVLNTQVGPQFSPHFQQEIHKYRVTSPRSWLDTPWSSTSRSYSTYQPHNWQVRNQPRVFSPPSHSDSARPAQTFRTPEYFSSSYTPGPYPQRDQWEMETSDGPSISSQFPHSSGRVSGGYNYEGTNSSPRTSQRFGSPLTKSWNRNYPGKGIGSGPMHTHCVSSTGYYASPYISENPSGHSQPRKNDLRSSDNSPLANTSTGSTPDTSWPLSTELRSGSPSSCTLLRPETRDKRESPSKAPVAWSHSTSHTSFESGKGISMEPRTLGEPPLQTKLGSSVGKGKRVSLSPKGKRKGGRVTAKIAGGKVMQALRRKIEDNATKRQKVQQTDESPQTPSASNSLFGSIKRPQKSLWSASNSKFTTRQPLRTSSTPPTYRSRNLERLPIMNQMASRSYQTTPSPVFLQRPNGPQYLLSPVEPTLNRETRSMRVMPDYPSSTKPTPTASNSIRLPPFQTFLSTALSKKCEPSGE